MDGAEFAGIHDALGFEEEIGAAALDADLRDAFGCAHGLDDGEAFVDRVGHGLFEIDVLARGGGIDGHAGMPVVGRRDDYGIEGLIVEQAAVIAVGLRAGGSLGERGLEVGVVDVADGRHLGAAFLEFVRPEAGRGRRTR